MTSREQVLEQELRKAIQDIMPRRQWENFEELIANYKKKGELICELKEMNSQLKYDVATKRVDINDLIDEISTLRSKVVYDIPKEHSPCQTTRERLNINTTTTKIGE